MTTQPLLDEQDFNAPDFLIPLPDQNIDVANNFCWYFQSSQFFEPASNNNAILNAHVNDPATYWVIHDRKEFNERLKSIPSGLQFVVAAEPQGEGQPWVYQRQNKVRDSEGKVDTFVEGNWYNQGTRIMMAPSLLDVVRARMLTVSTRLQQVAELSQNLAHWSPATGYSYFPPSYEAPKAAATGSRMGSRIGSPVLAPTDPDAAASQSQAQPAEAAASTTEFSDALFLQSLNLTNRYGDEYMDENPLTGEPGAFVFEKTRNAVDARNKAQVQSSQATQSSQASTIAKIDTQPPSTAPSVAPTPKAAATPAPLEAHSRKGSIASIPKDKKRERRKSKGLASPTTPGNPPGL